MHILFILFCATASALPLLQDVPVEPLSAIRPKGVLRLRNTGVANGDPDQLRKRQDTPVEPASSAKDERYILTIDT